MKNVRRFRWIWFVALPMLVASPTNAIGTLKVAYVSTKGVDAEGCGTATSPCRGFQQALSKAVAPGGILYITTPGDYGAATAEGGVTIINASGGVAGVLSLTSGQTAITINGKSYLDKVKLRGLTIDGSGLGANGIIARSVSTLGISDCDIKNLSNVGINAFSPMGGVRVYTVNTTFNNVDVAISASSTKYGSVKASIDNVTVTNASTGVAIGNGSSLSAPLSVALTNSSISASGDGVTINNGLIDRVKSIGNDRGIVVGVNAYVARSTVAGNRIGLEVPLAPLPSYTFMSNIVEGNSNADMVGSGLTPRELQ